MNLTQFQKEPLWRPDEKSGEKMLNFMKIIEKKYSVKLGNYWDFHKWSVENIAEFWGEFWNFIGVIYSRPYDKVIDVSIPMEECPKWFEGARLNFAENLLRTRSDKIALLLAGENRDVERVTYNQLYEETRLYAAAFRKLGLQKGDRVACYMSNRKEAILGMLATTSIGAIWTGGLPTLGAQAYLNRLKQVSPKFLITIDKFFHNKEKIDLLKNIKDITEGLPSLEKVIIIPSKPDSKLRNIEDIKNSCFLDDFLEGARRPDGTVPELIFEQISFSHPVFINYTSGTTGLPKTIVHGFGGLFTGIRDFWLHWNSKPNEVWLSMSPVGWISWNVILFLLFIERTVVIFEGFPYFLSPTFIWDMVDELQITKMFVTPTVLDQLEAKGFTPSWRVVFDHGQQFTVRSILFHDFYSQVGWVSWNMVNNLLFVRETIVLFEGVPYFLSPTYFWDMVEELEITRLFMTPAVLDHLEAKGYLPTEKHHLNSLNMILSGGSVVKPHNFEFVYANIKKGIQFSVGYGCTEIMGFCLSSELTLPVYKAEISAPCLGIALECLDNEGNLVIGEMGDIAISRPMPSLPLGLWNDTSGEKLRKSYFSKYPGKFVIGDTIIINPVTKGIIPCGRSDETLKQRGCRFGSSEIYNVVEMFPEIHNSLCVGQFSKNLDERAVLFVQMEPGWSFNEDLVQKLRKRIADELTERHVPEVILEAPGIPLNSNGKKTEIIVKKIINKMPHNAETVANSECLKYYYDIPELQGF